jgi:CheY-like chemotaxis protein
MDDEEMICDLTSAILGDLGYRVTTCSNGQEAIDLYRAAFQAGVPFQAVIMDLTIPGGMGGKEAAQNILDIDPKACLIVSSGYSHDQIVADYRDFGFSGVAVKPYTANYIASVLSDLVPDSSERT